MSLLFNTLSRSVIVFLSRSKHLWVIHVDVWQKSNQCCKAIINQLNINKYSLQSQWDCPISRQGCVPAWDSLWSESSSANLPEEGRISISCVSSSPSARPELTQWVKLGQLDREGNWGTDRFDFDLPGSAFEGRQSRLCSSSQHSRWRGWIFMVF